MTFIPGWVHNPRAIEAGIERRQTYAAIGPRGDARGDRLFCADWESDLKVFGRPQAPWDQKIGSCVGYGTARAAMACMVDRIAGGHVEVWRAPPSPAAVYGGSRVNIGKGELGREDGSIVAWAAEWVTRCLLLCLNYNGVDLGADLNVDRVAKSWGMSGVPASVVADGEQFAVTDTTQIDSAESLVNALWSRCWVSGGCNTLHSDKRDKFGQCKPSDRGGHCQNRCGVYIDQDGDTAILLRQSWGATMPSGNPQITLQDGSKVNLPDGVYGVKLEFESRALKDSGDFWALNGSGGWVPSSVNPGDFV